MKKLSPKVQSTLDSLVSKGYFKRKEDIINIALFEYFAKNGMFEAVEEDNGTK